MKQTIDDKSVRHFIIKNGTLMTKADVDTLNTTPKEIDTNLDSIDDIFSFAKQKTDYTHFITSDYDIIDDYFKQEGKIELSEFKPQPGRPTEPENFNADSSIDVKGSQTKKKGKKGKKGKPKRLTIQEQQKLYNRLSNNKSEESKGGKSRKTRKKMRRVSRRKGKK